MMDLGDIRKQGEKVNMSIAAAQVVRLLNMTGGYYMVRQMGPLLWDEEQIGRADLRTALDYLAESGYIAARTIKDKQAIDVADAQLDELECKLTPKGRRLAYGTETDPLVKP